MTLFQGVLLCVDPGLRGCGVALFDKGELFNATWVQNPLLSGRGPVVWARMAEAVWRWAPHPARIQKLYVEMPRVYPGMPKTDPNDLLDLAGVLGAVVSKVNPDLVGWTFPSEWKGQLPKEVMNERVKKHMTDGEKRKVVSVGALDHNTYDAIGLGMYFLGRTQKGYFG